MKAEDLKLIAEYMQWIEQFDGYKEVDGKLYLVTIYGELPDEVLSLIEPLTNAAQCQDIINKFRPFIEPTEKGWWCMRVHKKSEHWCTGEAETLNEAICLCLLEYLSHDKE